MAFAPRRKKVIRIVWLQSYFLIIERVENSMSEKYSEEERVYLANLKVQQSFSQKGGKGT
jgi:hypothetical protein